MAKKEVPKGFEISPRGALLDQIIEIEGDLGFAYERSCSFYKDFHVHDRLMFVCPRGTCQMEIRLEKSSQKYVVNSGNILSVPPDLVHDDEGISSIYDTFALYADKMFLTRIGKEIGISNSDIDLLYMKCHLFKRNRWIEQLLQEYFFRRVVKKDPLERLKFFEEQIVSELLLLSFEKKEVQGRQAEFLDQENSIAQKAIRYIETNLFSELDIESIAKAIGCSPSKFNKTFKEEFLKTPYTYIKERRLDEARCLLDKGQHNVTEVALMVGYENVGAFSEAFRKKYNKSPREFIR